MAQVDPKTEPAKRSEKSRLVNCQMSAAFRGIFQVISKWLRNAYIQFLKSTILL